MSLVTTPQSPAFRRDFFCEPLMQLYFYPSLQVNSLDFAYLRALIFRAFFPG